MQASVAVGLTAGVPSNRSTDPILCTCLRSPGIGSSCECRSLGRCPAQDAHQLTRTRRGRGRGEGGASEGRGPNRRETWARAVAVLSSTVHADARLVMLV